MPAYYDEEDPNAAGTDTEDYGTQFLTQDQAIARNDLLSAALPPTPVAVAQPQFTPTGPMGEASMAYRSGTPGLFVQGGPSVPAGMIEVNGQLERSQAAPQLVPWWITSADQYQEQRRQEDFLLNLLDRTKQEGQARGAQAINQANRLAAQLRVKAAVQGGIPLRDALASNPEIFSGAPSALARVAAIHSAARTLPTSATELTGPSGQTYYVNPATGGVSPLHQAKKSDLSPSQELAYIGNMIKVSAKDLEDANKEGDQLAAANARASIADLKAQADEIRGRKKGAPKQTQTSPRIALFRQLESEHPDWNKTQLITEVNNRLP